MPDANRKTERPTTWARAVLSALVALAALMTLAIGFNVAVGRTVHWDIVAALSAPGFIALTFAFRYSR